MLNHSASPTLQLNSMLGSSAFQNTPGVGTMAPPAFQFKSMEEPGATKCTGDCGGKCPECQASKNESAEAGGSPPSGTQTFRLADYMEGPTQGDKEGALQKVRVPVPGGIELCGRTVTHVDVEPPRWRDLDHCAAETGGSQVYRLNVVGRSVNENTTGKGRIVFNLHAGIFQSADGRWCSILDDSRECIASKCNVLGCSATMEEAMQIAVDAAKAVVITAFAGLAIAGAFLTALWDFFWQPGYGF